MTEDGRKREPSAWLDPRKDTVSKTNYGVRRALAFSFAQRYTGFIFEFTTVVIVSHILTPAQIGVFSVALGLTVLAQMLRTLGVPEYLVQAQVLDEATIKTAFTVTLLVCWSLATILFFTSDVLGRFYNDTGVADVMKVLSITFVLTPFGATAVALLKRDLAFGAVYKINTGSSLARSGCTIGLAIFGFGYMSMAWASLAGTLGLVIGSIIWAPHYRVRGVSLAKWRRIVPFGANRTAADIVIQIGEQSAYVVIGKLLGMAAAGLYSRGYSIVNQYREKVDSAIGAVALPAMAREHRENAAAPELYRRSLVYRTGIGWPFFGFAAIMASPIIRILFGPQWDASAPLMRWLCVAGFLGTLTYQCDLFFTAIGRVGAVTRIEIIYQTARIGLIVAAAFYSLQMVAASQVLIYAFSAILYYANLAKYEALKVRALIVDLMPSGVTALTSCIGPAVISIFWPAAVLNGFVAPFVVATATGGVGWMAGLYLTRHPLWSEIRGVVSAASGRWRRAAET